MWSILENELCVLVSWSTCFPCKNLGIDPGYHLVSIQTKNFSPTKYFTGRKPLDTVGCGSKSNNI